MKKILAAMSGGVDSAVACILLQRQGVTVGGGTMLLRPGGEEEAQMAADAAAQLGLIFHLFCWQEEFLQNVIEPFTRVYQQGGTPNPCIFCNRTMKFGRFLDAALELGYDGIATGHYAQVRFDTGSGRYLLLCAQDGAKDQTYRLDCLSQAQLARTRFPLGSMTKQEVRALAAEAGRHVAAKHDSQDICFVPDGDYMAYLRAHGLQPQPGHFRTLDGRDLGPHKGMEAYTLGQRRGLEIAAGERIYVVRKAGADVILGPQEALFSRTVFVGEINLIALAALRQPMRLAAKQRPAQFTRRRAASGWNLTSPSGRRRPGRRLSFTTALLSSAVGRSWGWAAYEKAFGNHRCLLPAGRRGACRAAGDAAAAAPVPGHNPGAGRSGAYDGLRICHQPGRQPDLIALS